MSYRQAAETRSFAYGEPGGELIGTATVCEGGSCASFPGPVRVDGHDVDEEWRLTGHGVELTFAPVGEVAELDLAGAGITSLHQLAHVHGTIALDGSKREVDCAGQRSRRLGSLDGKRFGALRAVTAFLL